VRDLYLEKSRKFFLQEAVCASVAFLIAVSVNYIFMIPHGYWIPMTVAVMFALPGQGVIVQRSVDRIFGTVLGLLFSFFYLSLLAYADYRWTYLLPFIFFLMYYCYYISNNYGIMAILMTMFVPILMAMTSEESMPLLPTLMARLCNTTIGIIIALLCEYTIFRFASLTSRDSKHQTREYFKTIGEVVNLCNKCFLDKKKFNKALRADIRKMMANLASLEALYINIKNELDFTESKEAILNRFFYDNNKIAFSIRKILAVISHDSIDESLITKDEFLEISNAISLKYMDVIRYIYEKSDDYTERMATVVSSLNNKCSSPTFFYICELAELNRIFDDFINFVHETRSSKAALSEHYKY